MKDNYTSFISEHTTEFALTSKLTSILKQKYHFVIPVFPWLSREGSVAASLIHKDDKFKVLGVYPKRPKINKKGNSILVKINHEFVKGSNTGSAYGIPFIAGSPLINNIWDLHVGSKFAWIKLNTDTEDYYLFDENLNSQFQNALIEEEELLILANDSKTQNYADFIKSVRHIQIETMTYSFFGTYKPIYFLIK